MAVMLMLLSLLSATACPSIAPNATAEGRIAALFWQHSGRYVWKWLHYFALYEMHFQRFRSHPVNMLEIGILGGGDMQLWNHYFPHVHVHGVDIEPMTQFLECPYLTMHVGSQANRTHLDAVVQQHGPFDIVLDDGSHMAEHIIASYDALFPPLAVGKLYWIEDFYQLEQLPAAQHVLSKSLADHCVHIYPMVLAIEKGNCSEYMPELAPEVLGMRRSVRQHQVTLLLPGADLCWGTHFRGRTVQVTGAFVKQLSPKVHNVVVLPVQSLTAGLIQYMVKQKLAGTVIALGPQPCYAARQVLLDLLPLVLIRNERRPPQQLFAIHCLPDVAVFHLGRHDRLRTALRPADVKMDLRALASAVATRLRNASYAPC